MLKRINILLIAFIAFAASQACAAPVRKVNDIKWPLFNSPVILLRGGSFDALFIGGKIVKKATLTGSFDKAALADLTLGDSSSGGVMHTQKLKVPADAKEALYDLTVEFTDGSSDTQPHAVKVIKEFKKKFDFVHFTDMHFNSSQAQNEVRAKIMKSMMDAKPEFVLFSGDFVTNPVTYDVDYPLGYNMLVKYMTEPIYMVPGNHECYVDSSLNPIPDGMEYWKAMLDIEYMSFDYGDLHVVGIDDFQFEKNLRERYSPDNALFGTQGLARIMPEQWDWLTKDLQAAKTRTKSTIAFMHIPLETFAGGRTIGLAKNRQKISGPGKDDFVSLLTGNNVTHVFIGHMHANDEKNFNGLKQIMTLTAGSNGDKEWGYRIVHVEDGRVTGWDVKRFTPEGVEIK